MTPKPGRVSHLIERLAAGQHSVFAIWQLTARGMRRGEIDAAVKRYERVHRGVYATGELTSLGRLMAAALAAGPGAAVSHESGLGLMNMRPLDGRDVDVSVPGRNGRDRRDGFVVHRPQEVELTRRHGIPVTTPTRTLLDTANRLKRHELYRAIEQADRDGVHLDRERLMISPRLREVLNLRDSVKGRTRSDTEAAFLFLCVEHGIRLPRVNHRLNRCEADFHWPRARLVVEIDGFDHHREKPQFEEDRRRGLTHRSAGFEVIRASADLVYDAPRLVVAAILSAAPALAI
jgi:very-short-patch-repair endonuclease